MATTALATETVYFKGSMGFIANPLGTMVDFSLLVDSDKHTVTGNVTITDGATKESYSGRVSGTTYPAGYGDIVRLINITGSIPGSNPLTPIQFPFEANMALKADWDGKGGFTFLGKHHDDVEVQGSIFKLDSAK